MREVIFRGTIDTLEDYARMLRLSACLGSSDVTVSNKVAMQVARLIEERGQAPKPVDRVLVVERPVPLTGLAWDMLAITCAFYFFLAVKPAAKYIAGLF